MMPISHYWKDVIDSILNNGLDKKAANNIGSHKSLLLESTDTLHQK